MVRNALVSLPSFLTRSLVWQLGLGILGVVALVVTVDAFVAIVHFDKLTCISHPKQ